MKTLTVLLCLITLNCYAKDECATKAESAAKAVARLNSSDVGSAAIRVSAPQMGEGGSLIYSVAVADGKTQQLYKVTTAQSEGPCQIINVSTESINP